jgi:hypothetical protein
MSLSDAYFVGNILAVLILGAAWGYLIILALRGVRWYRDRYRNGIF